VKKKVSKLKLTRETLHFLGHVSGSASEDTICGYTCAKQCRPVPSVDECGTNPVGGCASGTGACPTGICITSPYNGCY
jgi:hypothetical protein